VEWDRTMCDVKRLKLICDNNDFAIKIIFNKSLYKI